MKSSGRVRNSCTVIVISVALIALASLPWVSLAKPFATSVNITNNSGREIRGVYTATVGGDDWSSNLLGNAIATGQAGSVGNISCDGQEVEVIAEDQDGCFLRTVIACGQSSGWTVTSDTARDCGSY